MPLKSFKPYTHSRRSMTVEDFSVLTKKSPEKSLLMPLRKSGGRNNTGQVMVRHHGGGHKRNYRIVDFKREKTGVPAKVVAFEYDPGRSAHLALLHYVDGEKRYILQPSGLNIGDLLMSGPQAEIRVGNALPFTNIPIGAFIHNIELVPGFGGKMVRSAGGAAQLMARENGFAQIKLPSGEIRLVPDRCMATIGQVGNIDHENLSFGSAGRSRHKGIRPTVRGTHMNATDHPHGGGRGRSKGGNHPRSPWNQPTKGYKTKKPKRHDWMIVQRRSKNSKSSAV